MTHMSSSAAFALKDNTNFLRRKSPRFVVYKKKIEELKQLQTFDHSGVINADTMAKISFIVQKNAQAKHKCHCQCNIGHSMNHKIEFFCQALDPALGIWREFPIMHLVERDPLGFIFSVSCLCTGGGYSLQLHCIWY